MKKEINQVRYNSKRSENNPSCIEWYFLIINKDKREISRIHKNICNLFAPIVEEYSIPENISRKNLNLKLIHFDSELKTESDWKSRIFKRIIKDNNLYNRRENPDGLENYISEIKFS